MQEYLGNIGYALVLRRLRTVTLWIVFAASGIGLIWVANSKGSLDGGWDYPNIWMAPLRLIVSFVLGLSLYRIHDRVRMPKLGLLILSIVLVVCFQMPKFSKTGALDWNGLYDAACVLFLFPLIILCGAHSNAGTGMIGSANSRGASRIPSTSRTSGSFISLPVMRGPGIQAQGKSFLDIRCASSRDFCCVVLPEVLRRTGSGLAHSPVRYQADDGTSRAVRSSTMTLIF